MWLHLLGYGEVTLCCSLDGPVVPCWDIWETLGLLWDLNPETFMLVMPKMIAGKTGEKDQSPLYSDSWTESALRDNLCIFPAILT